MEVLVEPGPFCKCDWQRTAAVGEEAGVFSGGATGELPTLQQTLHIVPECTAPLKPSGPHTHKADGMVLGGWLRAHAALAEDPSSVPHALCNSTSVEILHFWPLQTPVCTPLQHTHN